MKTPSRSLVLHSWHVYVATVLVFALILFFGFPRIHVARALQLTNVSDLISTSAPGPAAANHTITFTTPTGVPADGSTIVITIPTGFNVAGLTEDDVDVEDDGVNLTTDTVCGAVGAAVTFSSQDISIEICSGASPIVAGSVVTIEIGNHADTSGTGANQIVNHVTEGDYEVLIGGTMTDEGFTKIAIIESVTVTGEVNNYFNFAITGVVDGQTVNADAQTTTGTTTATTVPFGLVQSGNEYVMAQDLTVSTNSNDGFTVRVFADGDLESGAGATIDSFADGGGDATPAIWAQPSGISGTDNTYGHWGLTTEDITLSDDDSFGDALYVGNFVDNPREVFYGTSSADSLTDHIGKTRVGYKLEITDLQEAATDYTTRLVYVATPVF